MNLRDYKPSDFVRVSELFRETINSVNIADYTKEQCAAWTAKSNCLDTRRSDELEKGFERVTTYSSVTAKPFFEKRNYNVVKAQEVDCLGVFLQNFQMQKTNDNR